MPGGGARARRVRLLLNGALLFLLALCVVSGLMVSGTVLPAFGFVAQGFFFWDPLHAFSAKALAALLLVHIVLNGRRALGMARYSKGHSGAEGDRG